VRGLGGIADALDRVLQILGVELAAWMAPTVIGLGCLLMIPWIRSNQRSQRVRNLLRRIASEERMDREQMRAKAFEVVGDDVDALILLADEANRRGLQSLALEATTRLAEVGGRPQEVRRLQAQLRDRPPVHIEGERAAIESLMAEQMWAAAKIRLNSARDRWPSDTHLTELERTIEE
jgi:hypothetical protein